MMASFQGKLIEIYPENAGTNLNSDHASGAQTLIVNSKADFSPAGGELEINGSIYVYDSLVEKYDWDEIHITTGLLSATGEGTEVISLPLRTRRIAMVAVTDGNGEVMDTVRARLDHALQLALVDGRRDAGKEEEVVCNDENGDTFLVQVIDSEPVLDTTKVGPFDLDLHSDGLGPDNSPDVLLTAHSVGALRWAVVPIPNADPSKFKIYASTNPTVELDAAHLVHDGPETAGTFDDINGVRLLPEDPSATIPLYYARAIQYDIDDQAPPGASTAVGVRPRRAAVQEISAEWAYLGSVEANQITSGSLLSDLILAGRISVGPYIDIDGSGSGMIALYADTAHTSALLQLLAAGAVFRGKVEAGEVSTFAGIVMQTLLNKIDSGALLELTNGVPDPNSAPTITSNWQKVTYSSVAIPSGYTMIAVCDHGTAGYYTRLLHDSAAERVAVQVIDTATSTEVSFGLLANVTGFTEDKYSGIIYYGGYYYVCVQNYNNAGYDDVWLCKFNATTRAFVSKTKVFDFNLGQDHGDTFCRMGIDYVNGDILCSPRLSDYFIAVDAATMAYVGLTTFGSSGTPGNWFGYGPFDYGSNTYLADLYYSDDVSASTTSWASVSSGHARAWNDADSAKRFWHEAEQKFYVWTGTAMYRQAPFLADTVFWARYADIDATYHTKLSPASSLLVTRRKYATVALPPKAAGTLGSEIYVGYGASQPALSGLYERAEALPTNRSMLLANGYQTSGANPVDTSTFPAGSPGAIKSTAAAHNIELYGSGEGKFQLEQGKYFWQGYLSASQSIPTNVETIINTWVQHGTHIFTHADFFTFDAATGKVTVNKTGWYIITSRIKWATNNSSFRDFSIYKNGSQMVESTNAGTSAKVTQNLRQKAKLTAGDYLQISVKHNVGSSLGIDGNSQLPSIFSVEWAGIL